MDSPDVYPDALGDALSHSSQRLAQLGSLITAAATMQIRRRAQAKAANAARSQRELRALQKQQRAAWQLARAGWAPAHDSRWLAHADLLQTARVWGAAAAYADTDPAATSAARRCEERLRVLHPYAMARYDRLRSEGAGAFEAMRQAVPLFGRAPHARPGDPGAGRRALEAPAGRDGALPDSDAGRTPERGPGSGPERQAEEHGMRLAQQLQANTVAERGYALSPDELATTLAATTTLPGDVIARLTHASSHDRVTSGAGRTRDHGVDGAFPGHWSRDSSEQVVIAGHTGLGADIASAHLSRDRTAAQLAAESFPGTAADAVLAVSNPGTHAGQSRTRTVTSRRIRPSGRSG